MRPAATEQRTLGLAQRTCRAYGSQLLVARHSHRAVTALQGVYRLRVKVYQCLALAKMAYFTHVEGAGF